MYKALIIDDEPLARSVLKEYLAHLSDVQVVGECGNGLEGVKLIHQLQPDVVFLDVQMPKITGFEMLELLDEKPAIIFTTAFDEYALKAFDANAVDYLLKPFSQERLLAAFEKLRHRGVSATNGAVMAAAASREQSADESRRIVIRNGANIDIVPVEEIVYLEAYDDYVKIFTKNDYFLKKQTISNYEEKLGKFGFLRVHRSFLVNVSAIQKVEPYEKSGHIAILSNARQVPVSRSGYVRLRQDLGL